MRSSPTRYSKVALKVSPTVVYRRCCVYCFSRRQRLPDDSLNGSRLISLVASQNRPNKNSSMLLMKRRKTCFMTITVVPSVSWQIRGYRARSICRGKAYAISDYKHLVRWDAHFLCQVVLSCFVPFPDFNSALTCLGVTKDCLLEYRCGIYSKRENEDIGTFSCLCFPFSRGFARLRTIHVA